MQIGYGAHREYHSMNAGNKRSGRETENQQRSDTNRKDEKDITPMCTSDVCVQDSCTITLCSLDRRQVWQYFTCSQQFVYVMLDMMETLNCT